MADRVTEIVQALDGLFEKAGLIPEARIKVLSALGVPGATHAMTRVGRHPIEFVEGESFPIPGVTPAAAGSFDTGSKRITMARGRTPRQKSRTAVHEDIHGVLDEIMEREGIGGFATNKSITHGLVGQDIATKTRASAQADLEALGIKDPRLDKLTRNFDIASGGPR